MAIRAMVTTLISIALRGRLRNGFPAVRMTKTTSVWVASDSTNQPVWKSCSLAWHRQRKLEDQDQKRQEQDALSHQRTSKCLKEDVRPVLLHWANVRRWVSFQCRSTFAPILADLFRQTLRSQAISETWTSWELWVLWRAAGSSGC
jgi:hypothetical protein